MSYPVDPRQFEMWCDDVGGFPQRTENNFTGEQEVVCTFDEISESDGAQVKTFMNDEGYLMVSTDGDTIHKFRDSEMVELQDWDGRDVDMRVDVETDKGLNSHEFVFEKD